MKNGTDYPNGNPDDGPDGCFPALMIMLFRVCLVLGFILIFVSAYMITNLHTTPAPGVIPGRGVVAIPVPSDAP